VKAVDLHERDLAFIERVGDVLALAERPIPMAIDTEPASLDAGGIVAANRAIAARRAVNQHALRPEHRSFDVDTSTTVGRAAWVQPPHVCNHAIASTE
jgi:hypothetical protein